VGVGLFHFPFSTHAPFPLARRNMALGTRSWDPALACSKQQEKFLDKKYFKNKG